MDTLFTDATASTPGTPLVAAWHNDANSVVYNTLAAVTGVNTITAVGPLSMSAYALGQRFFFVPVSLNSGATTININGLGAKAILFAGVALEANMLVPGHVAEIYYDGTNFQLMNSQTFPLAQATGILPVANGGSGVAVAANAPWNPGRLLGIQRFTANGSYTSTIGTSFIIVEAVGGGGAGGGANVTGSGQVSCGAGGASGSWGRARINSALTGSAVIIGSGGAGVPGGAGASGGATSLGGTLVVAPGGGGGSFAATATGTLYSLGGVSGGNFNATGVALIAAPGAPGQLGVATAPTEGCSGNGASSPYGGGGQRIYQGNGANAGVNTGAGGSGGHNPQNDVNTRTGGNGGSGLLIIYEYA